MGHASRSLPRELGLTGLVSLPDLGIRLGGVELSDAKLQALAEVRVQQTLSRPALCELRFEVFEADFSAGLELRTGADLELVLRSHAEPLFSGQVTALEYEHAASGETTVRLRAYDRLHVLRKRHPQCRHLSFDLGDLARELVSDLGIEVVASDAGPRYADLVQHDQDDLSLLVDLAERAGLYWTLRGERLHLVSSQGLGDPIPLTLGKELREARVEINADRACRSVRAWAWDPKRAEGVEAQAESARQGRSVAASGYAELSTVDGARAVTARIVESDAQLAALAQAELDRCAAEEVWLCGVSDGDPRLCPGAVIEVGGIDARVCGRYVLGRVLHLIQPDVGYVARLDTRPPEAPAQPRGASTALGRVSRVDDPEERGRVRVTLPSHGGIESDWLEVLAPGAGPGKGLVATPDLDDRVLVLVPEHDPSRGIVLGGLFGPERPADAGVSGAVVRRFGFSTAGGERLVLDDEEKSATLRTRAGDALRLENGKSTLENAEGSRFVLSRRGVELHSERDLLISAPGRHITIQAARIDFEEA